MSTFPHGTALTGLQRLVRHFPIVPSFSIFLFSFVSESERPTEANQEKECPLNHDDKMKVLAALDMLETKLTGSGQALTAPEIEIYEAALRVVGPLD